MDINHFIGSEFIYYANEYESFSPFTSGSYVDFPDKSTCLTEGILFTKDNCIIIATHGNESGYILHYEKIKEIIRNPRYKKYKKYIHCCYQKQVGKSYPDLKKYLLDPDCDLYTGTCIPIRYSNGAPLGPFVLYKDYVGMCNKYRSGNL